MDMLFDSSSSSSSSIFSSSSSYEDFLLLLNMCTRKRKHRVEHFIEEVVDSYTDGDFRENFGVSKSSTDALVLEFETSRFFNKSVEHHGGKKEVSAMLKHKFLMSYKISFKNGDEWSNNQHQQNEELRRLGESKRRRISRML